MSGRRPNSMNGPICQSRSSPRCPFSISRDGVAMK
jgi:hypothetical protein